MQAKYYQLQAEIAELNYKLMEKSDELKKIEGALLAAIPHEELIQTAYQPRGLAALLGFKLF